MTARVFLLLYGDEQDYHSRQLLRPSRQMSKSDSMVGGMSGSSPDKNANPPKAGSRRYRGANEVELSIITVCFNEGKSIEKTLQSLLQQSYREFEYIVIDGGSSDDTKSILGEYAHIIDHLVSEPDQGIYDAMNKGAQLSNGRYLYFLNGGDMLAAEDTLERLMKENPTADIVYGDRYMANADGQLIYQSQPQSIDAIYVAVRGLYHQSALIKNGPFRELGGYDRRYSIASDFDMFIRLLTKSRASTQYVNIPFCIFNTDGVSHDPEYQDINQSERSQIRRRNFSFRYLLIFQIRSFLLDHQDFPLMNQLLLISQRMFRFFFPVK